MELRGGLTPCSLEAKSLISNLNSPGWEGQRAGGGYLAVMQGPAFCQDPRMFSQVTERVSLQALFLKLSKQKTKLKNKTKPKALNMLQRCILTPHSERTGSLCASVIDGPASSLAYHCSLRHTFPWCIGLQKYLDDSIVRPTSHLNGVFPLVCGMVLLTSSL